MIKNLWVVFLFLTFLMPSMGYASKGFYPVCMQDIAFKNLQENSIPLVGRLSMSQSEDTVIRYFNELIKEAMQFNALIRGCGCKTLVDAGNKYEFELYYFQLSGAEKIKEKFSNIKPSHI